MDKLAQLRAAFDAPENKDKQLLIGKAYIGLLEKRIEQLENAITV
jgi:hypothetical protein